MKTIICLGLIVIYLTQGFTLDIGPTTATNWYLFLHDILEGLKDILLSYDSNEWTKISQIKLTEKFIDEFAEKVDWEMISYYQNLTEYTMKKYKEKIDWYWIYEQNKFIPQDLKTDLDNYFEHRYYEYLQGRYRTRNSGT